MVPLCVCGHAAGDDLQRHYLLRLSTFLQHFALGLSQTSFSLALSLSLTLPYALNLFFPTTALFPSVLILCSLPSPPISLPAYLPTYWPSCFMAGRQAGRQRVHHAFQPVGRKTWAGRAGKGEGGQGQAAGYLPATLLLLPPYYYRKTWLCFFFSSSSLLT